MMYLTAPGTGSHMAMSWLPASIGCMGSQPGAFSAARAGPDAIAAAPSRARARRELLNVSIRIRFMRPPYRIGLAKPVPTGMGLGDKKTILVTMSCLISAAEPALSPQPGGRRRGVSPASLRHLPHLRRRPDAPSQEGIAPHAVAKRVPRHPQHFGGPRLVALRALERLADEEPLGLLEVERGEPLRRLRLGAGKLEREILAGDLFPREDHGALDDV